MTRMYDNPWTGTLLADAFRDGDYTRDPAWRLASGSYRVDDRPGLVSEVSDAAAVPSREDAFGGPSLANLQGRFAVRRVTLRGGS